MENQMVNQYVKLVFEALPASLDERRQELCQRFLRKCPGPLAIKRLSRVEKEEMLMWAPEMTSVFAALELGGLVANSYEEVIGHAYSSVELGREMVARFHNEEQENISVACTNVRNEIIAWKTLFIGGSSECVLYPDRIFHYALKNSAHGIALIHNHPSGNTKPSRQDTAFMRRLERGCGIIGLHLLDFLIVGRDSYYSFRENEDVL